MSNLKVVVRMEQNQVIKDVKVHVSRTSKVKIEIGKQTQAQVEKK